MSVERNNSSYRRGVLLGLTMAEIIMLIIFLLLLAFSALLDKAKKEAVLLSNGNPQVERVIHVFSSQPPDMAEDMVRATEKLPAVISLIKEKGLEKEKGEPLEQIIIRGLEKLQAEKEAKEATNQGSTEQQLVAALEKKKELEAEMKNLTDQKKSLISQIESKGRGVDWPPCWPDSSGKGTEFLFNIDLTHDGIVMFDATPAHRAEAKARLPMQNIKYEVPRNKTQFLAETAPIFKWSTQNECRFYVYVHDKTGTNEKVLFKNFLLTVEGHFYKRLDTAQEVSGEDETEEDKNIGFFGSFFNKKKNGPKAETYN